MKNAFSSSAKITLTFLSTLPLLGAGRERFLLCDVLKTAQELSICAQEMLVKLIMLFPSKFITIVSRIGY